MTSFRLFNFSLLRHYNFLVLSLVLRLLVVACLAVAYVSAEDRLPVIYRTGNPSAVNCTDVPFCNPLSVGDSFPPKCAITSEGQTCELFYEEVNDAKRCFGVGCATAYCPCGYTPVLPCTYDVDTDTYLCGCQKNGNSC